MTIPFLIFCVLFAASHVIQSIASAKLTGEQQRMVRKAWAGQGAWPMLAVLGMVGVGALLTLSFGHNELFIPTFFVAAIGAAIWYAFAYFRQLTFLDLPESYLTAARVALSLTYGGALVLLVSLVFQTIQLPSTR